MTILLFLVGLSLIVVVRSDCNSNLCTRDTPCVRTTSGCIRGRSSLVELAPGSGIVSGRVKSFLGVPYAQPPIGNLRFADPQPPQPWGDRVVTAQNYGPSCLGVIDTTYPGFRGSEMWNPPGNISEDCLYLNIWMRETRDSSERLPVMIWVFGGGYFSGTSSLDVYRGQFLALFKNVIVVSMNYRLGSLGFLSTMDQRIKGNFGLKDQRLAIKWVHDNLDNLGGDASSVVLFGESAGAASIGYHLVNEETSGYFTRAIMHSASQLAPWAYTKPHDAIERSQKLFEKLSCPDNQQILQCLRRIPAQNFVDNDWVISNMMFFPWTPTQDQDFIKSDPLHDLQTSTLAKKDILFASNKDEGTFWIVYNFANQFSKDRNSVSIDQSQLRADFDLLTSDLPSGSAKEALYREYSRVSSSTDGTRNSKLLDLILGDRHFTCPTEYFGQHYTDARMYYLQLYYRDSREVWPDWMGVIHGADCQWAFGIPLDKGLTYRRAEVDLATKILLYYTNFVKTGDPNNILTTGLPRWPEYTPATGSLLRITETGQFRTTTFGDEFYGRQQACAKWNQIEDSSTCCDVIE